MLKVTGEETRDEGLQDVEVPQRAPARSKELREETKDRSPSSREGPAIEKQRPETPEDLTSRKPSASHARALRRRPIASALGAILAAAVMGAGAIYFDYTDVFSIDRRRLHRLAPDRDRPESVGLRHSGSGHRQ